MNKVKIFHASNSETENKINEILEKNKITSFDIKISTAMCYDEHIKTHIHKSVIIFSYNDEN